MCLEVVAVCEQQGTMCFPHGYTLPSPPTSSSQSDSICFAPASLLNMLTSMPYLLSPNLWRSHRWEDGILPAPNFQPVQRTHIPRVQWLIKGNLGHPRVAIAILQICLHSFPIPASFSLFISFLELLLLLGLIFEIGLLQFDLWSSL